MTEAVKVAAIMCAIALAFSLGLAILPDGGMWIGGYFLLFVSAFCWIVGAYAAGIKAANHLLKTMAILWGGLILIAGFFYLSST